MWTPCYLLGFDRHPNFKNAVADALCSRTCSPPHTCSLTWSFVCLYVQGSQGGSPTLLCVSTAIGPPAGSPSRLDITDLAPTVQHFFEAGLAPSTHTRQRQNVFITSSPHTTLQNHFHSRSSYYAPMPPTSQSKDSPHRLASLIYRLSGACKSPWASQTHMTSPPCQSWSVCRLVLAEQGCSSVQQHASGSRSPPTSWTEWESNWGLPQTGEGSDIGCGLLSLFGVFPPGRALACVS